MLDSKSTIDSETRQDENEGIPVSYRRIQGIVGEQSFSVILPKSFAINLGIGKGDFVKVRLEGQRITIEKADWQMQLNYWVSEVLNTIDKSYETRTYNELSDEFKRTYSRACDLIPLMYDRLTLIDGESHEFALMKIYNDHKDLPGFSKRNINRYLPSDNPTIPRRVPVPQLSKPISSK
jgi:bifunctional DNA-binding transcriptional regulator/antitoxin component of YhaV-PrlF toxin-antitoxin module